MLPLSELRVIHLTKADANADFSATVCAEAFAIDSCLRRVWVTEVTQEADLPPGAEVYVGTVAYEFLLRLACGLESRIAGETDIFGQLKEAWQRFSAADSEWAQDLSPWMQKLFEDTKEIRSLYLRSVGGASYGSLVRKLIGGGAGERVLLLGAGRLAQSVAPFLAEGAEELWIWNRSRERAQDLARECRSERKGARIRVLSSADELAQALGSADKAVSCVPFDSAGDAERIAAWRAHGEARRFVHLGGLRSQAGEWAGLSGYVALDELFDLARAQDDLRSTQVSRSRKACEEKAKLRALGGSSATQHGWEDLAVFAGVGS